jgi:hypothetical protein
MTANNSVRTATAIADPNNPANVLVPNAWNGAAVTKSDATVFSPPALGLYVGAGGDVAVHMYGNQQNVTYVAVPTGTLLKIVVDQVLSTGTTASSINRIW